MDCDVLRCGNPGRSQFNAGTPESGPYDVSLCEEHQTAIDQGADWIYQLEEENRAGRLLMGRDLPPRAVEARAKNYPLASGRRRSIFTFVVEGPDASRHEVEFEVPPYIAEGVWCVVSRGRRNAEPGPP
jgi:hypothetical protein